MIFSITIFIFISDQFSILLNSFLINMWQPAKVTNKIDIVYWKVMDQNANKYVVLLQYFPLAGS